MKQADVLLLFQLLPDHYAREVVETNYKYYEPRTGHGSSLSPATHALVAARLGYLSSAARFFKLAADIDLGNAMGNSSGGIHGATCGGLWQAVVFGFAGLQVLEDKLAFDPHLPADWAALRIALIYRGRHLTVALDGEPLRTAVSMRKPGEPIRVTIGRVDGIVSWQSPLIVSSEIGGRALETEWKQTAGARADSED